VKLKLIANAGHSQCSFPAGCGRLYIQEFEILLTVILFKLSEFDIEGFSYE